MDNNNPGALGQNETLVPVPPSLPKHLTYVKRTLQLARLVAVVVAFYIALPLLLIKYNLPYLAPLPFVLTIISLVGDGLIARRLRSDLIKFQKDLETAVKTGRIPEGLVFAVVDMNTRQVLRYITGTPENSASNTTPEKTTTAPSNTDVQQTLREAANL